MPNLLIKKTLMFSLIILSKIQLENDRKQREEQFDPNKERESVLVSVYVCMCAQIDEKSKRFIARMCEPSDICSHKQTERK